MGSDLASSILDFGIYARCRIINVNIQLEFRKAELESTMMTALTAYNMIQFLKSKVSFCPVHFSRNSCNISLKMAGFSANGA